MFSQSLLRIKKNALNIIILGGICFSAIFLMATDIQKPGLYYDDAGHPSVALQIIKHDPVSRYWSVGTVELFGYNFPIWGDYEGTISTYTVLPFVFLFGPTMEAIRIFGIVIVVLTIISTYFAGKEVYNEKVGILSAILFAVTPSVIFLSKIPTCINLIMCLFGILSFYFILKWKNLKKDRFLILGFLMLGLGISTKVTFWWIPLVFSVSLILFRPKLKINLKKITMASISLILGSSIWITAFTKYHEWFLSFFFSRLTSTPQGSSNTTFLSNLLERFNEFVQLLSTNSFTWLGGTHQNLIFPGFFLITIIGIFIIKIKNHNSYFRKSVFLFYIIVSILFISTITISTRNFWQLLILFPFVQILMSVFIIQIFEKLKKYCVNKIVSLICLLALSSIVVIPNLVMIEEYKVDLNATNGVGFFSIQFNNMVDYLMKNKITNVVALDWGFTREIYYLSDSRIIPIENVVYPGENFDVFNKNLETYIKNPDIIYLKYYKDTPIDGSLINLKEIVEENHKQLIIVKVFKDWDGSDLIYLYKVK